MKSQWPNCSAHFRATQLKIILLLILLAGCQIKTGESQVIEISTYPTTSQNFILAQEIIQYNPNYFASKIPSLNKSTGAGVKWSISKSLASGNPGVVVHYDTENGDVKNSINSLKQEFYEFVPALAKQHASKSALFEILKLEGLTWAENLHKNSASQILDASSERFRKTVDADQLNSTLQSIRVEYGALLSSQHIRSQFYEAHANKPDFVSLHYLQRFSNKKKLIVKITMFQSNSIWSILGFNIVDTQ